jgi:uncharacterized protein involved in response to NO
VTATQLPVRQPPPGPPQVPAFTAPGVDPYRVLFPIGLLYSLLAALAWPLHVAGALPYPAGMHWTLMIQGFVHCFILGFLLTALPAFLHADRCHRLELAFAAGSMALLGVATLAWWAALAQAAYLLSLATLFGVAARRIPVRRGDPPEEFVFVAMGLLFGIGGGFWGLAAAAGWAPEPAPRFALRLIERGLVLCIVLGVGGLLVPTFAAMKDPLVVPGIAKPGERRPRRRLYVPIALLFVAALVAEGYGHATLGAWLRVAAATPLLALVWKLFRLPGRRDLLSFTIWTAGWFIGIGIWFSALVPAHEVAGFHFMFLGGFGLLILGIATRVVVTHGKYPLQYERSILRPHVVALVLTAIALRLVGDFLPAQSMRFFAASGVAWTLAWIDWGWRAVPCMWRKAPETVVLERLKYAPKR